LHLLKEIVAMIISTDSTDEPVGSEKLPEVHYAHPVAQLLSYGNCAEDLTNSWPDYLSLGFTEADVPELVRMACDSTLQEWPAAESHYLWAPVHAWRTLGQLRSPLAIEPLLALFDVEEDEWVQDELPIVYSMIGPAAIPTLSKAVQAQHKFDYQRASIARCLEQIAEDHPDSRSDCIDALYEALRQYLKNDPEWNGLLICSLLMLKAVEAAPLIQEAYEAGCVDERTCGSWRQVGIALGVLEITPEERKIQERIQQRLAKEEALWQRQCSAEDNEYANKLAMAQKNKQKRKAAKVARKLNRKRK